MRQFGQHSSSWCAVEIYNDQGVKLNQSAYKFAAVEADISREQGAELLHDGYVPKVSKCAISHFINKHLWGSNIIVLVLHHEGPRAVYPNHLYLPVGHEPALPLLDARPRISQKWDQHPGGISTDFLTFYK